MMNRLHRAAGLTLIEIMFVIAIILVLIALLMPAMGNAMESGRLAAGMSHLHQLGMAHVNYASDFKKRVCDADDYLSVDWRPPFTNPWPNLPTMPERSILIVGGWMSNDVGVFRCPSDDGERKDRKDITFAYQYIRSGSPFSYTRNAVADNYAQYARLDNLPRPAETPLLVEEHELSPMNDGVFYGNAFDFLTQRHYGRVGALVFFDGHSEAHDSRIYNQQTSWWRSLYLNPR